jgi:hypothetical protein
MKCYRCGRELACGDTRCPGCGQAVYSTRPASGLSMGRRTDGWVRDKPSP